MAITCTVNQLTLTSANTAYPLTATAGQRLQRGVKIAVVSSSGKVYFGGSGVTAANGFYLINGYLEIHPGDAEFCSDICLLSDTAGVVVSFYFVGQTVAIS